MTSASPTPIETATREPFADRHIGPGEEALAQMLASLGVGSLAELTERTVPAAIRTGRPLALPAARTEAEALASLRAMAQRNRIATSLIGMGYYGTHVPGVILRNVLENPGWYTAYTPYQAEVSQGRLEAVLNYQQMVADLTGMELANASLLDEATAAAEAMTMAARVARSKSRLFFVDAACHPQTLAVLRTRAHHLGFELRVGDPLGELDGLQPFGALFQYPASDGRVRDLRGSRADLRLLSGRGTFERDDLFEVLVGVRPLYRGTPPAAFAHLAALNDEVRAAIEAVHAAAR